MKYSMLYALILFSFSGYCQDIPKKPFYYENIDDKTHYWKLVNPLMFLDTLKKHPYCIFNLSEVAPNYWYDTTFISDLKKYVNDTTECGRVMLVYESQIYSQNSTIGVEAEKIIIGIRKKRYPAIW